MIAPVMDAGMPIARSSPKAACPTSTACTGCYSLSRVLHILGAIVLVGGLFYLRMVVAPPVSAGSKAVGRRLVRRPTSRLGQVGRHRQRCC